MNEAVADLFWFAIIMIMLWGIAQGSYLLLIILWVLIMMFIFCDKKRDIEEDKDGRKLKNEN